MAFINISKYTMKHQPKSINHRDKRHKVYPGKPSWGRKPSNFFSIDSIFSYNANTMISKDKDQTLEANPSHKVGSSKNSQILAKRGSKDVHCSLESNHTKL